VIAPCAAPISWADAVAYVAGELSLDHEATLELHLMGCAACTASVTGAAEIAAAARSIIPTAVTRADLAAIAARGLRVREGAFAPGDRRAAVFTPDVDLLIHALVGADLAGATRVDVRLKDERTGAVLVEEPDVPFDAAAGEVLIACQRHYASFPPDIVFELTAHRAGGTTLAGTYTVLHDYGA
jgi:hypothetical protein